MKCVAGPLGERGGRLVTLPPVDLAGLLDEHPPGLADQARHPRALLCGAARRPAKVKRPRARADVLHLPSSGR
eukprot:7399707-Pyramimonas_sp.AAC.1